MNLANELVAYQQQLEFLRMALSTGATPDVINQLTDDLAKARETVEVAWLEAQMEVR